MLRFDRRQLRRIGGIHLHQSLRDFLALHVPQVLDLPEGELSRSLEAVIERSRQLGLNTQRGVAAYALACALFGQEQVDAEPALSGALRDRQRDQVDRALLIEIWLTQVWGSFNRAGGS